MLCFTPNGHNPNHAYLSSCNNPDMFDEEDIITKLIDPSDLHPFNLKELQIPTYFENLLLDQRHTTAASRDSDDESEPQQQRKDFITIDSLMIIYPKYEPSMRKIKIRDGSYYTKSLPYLNANNTIGSKQMTLITNWFYHHLYDPEQNVVLSLIALNIAKSEEAAFQIQNDWSLMVRVREQQVKIENRDDAETFISNSQIQLFLIRNQPTPRKSLMIKTENPEIERNIQSETHEIQKNQHLDQIQIKSEVFPVQQAINIDRSASEIDALTLEISSLDNMINAALSDLGIKDPPPSDCAAAPSSQKVASGNQSGSIGSKSERLEDDLIDFVSLDKNGQITDIESVKKSSIKSSSKRILKKQKQDQKELKRQMKELKKALRENDKDQISKIKSQKTPKNLSKIKSETIEGPRISACGLYEMNSRDPSCFSDNKVVQFLNQAKQEVFQTKDDFENLLMGSINSFSTITYLSHETSKYVNIKCSKCQKFRYWFKNKDDKDINQIEEGEQANLIFFRSINQGHLIKDHPEIQF